MLDFSDKPYRYFPPKRNPLAAWLLGLYNRFVALPRSSRIVCVELSGQIEALRRRGRDDRLLFLPNHPSHADAFIYLEALRRIGISTHVMAAYDVFLRSGVKARMMQRMGCFSVDREGSDAKAMKQAADTLARGRHALTIFPEGNVYLQNDVLTPFHEGAAFLALRNARSLAEQGARILAVPVSIKLTHVQDVRAAQLARLHELAETVGAGPQEGASPLETVREVGRAALLRHLRQRGVEVPAAETLPELIERAAESMVERLERKMDLTPRARDSLIERIRRTRRVVHEIRLDPSRAHDHAVAGQWADEAMLALRIASYSAAYVASRPTIDRVVETIEKLSEDVYFRQFPPSGLRHAFVDFGPPIDTTAYLDSFRAKARRAASELTAACEKTVQAGLDALNERNPHVGGRLWAE